ncbi:DUF3284 domain-containing protein [Vagococcus intermedius]|uniref:DUF3284 domain-containing protein n=1 Tax=Vagococcus intermedius TaxID=2991418 RepID=A0AAF0CVS6_9ENTE|nr:DUF3284 domain-containing protein [Vagococcus intermedius]WEG73774.1 DUF3284 domain-containing protein [Vagococcus intermedius]WEG75859.1 DUF3284 domain-containing protein [Vagococcus intermedius]
MQIVKKLNVPAPFLYDKIIDSVLFDIRKQTGKSVTRKQLNNYEYVKEFSKTSRAKIKIEKHIENEAYHFRTSTTRNDFLVKYDIRPLDDKSCEVVYEEEMKSFGVMQKMNDVVVGLLVGFLKKRQFKKMLEMIETSY